MKKIIFSVLFLVLSFWGTNAGTCTIASVISTESSCETSVVFGLTKQIAGVLSKMGIFFADIPGNTGISCTGGCSGYIQKSALTSLESITKSVSRTINIDSAWRSCAQQYLLYQWKAQYKCGQTNPVAVPGTSNHEGGIAIDVPDYNSWISSLTNHGWNYPMPDDDPVHFEFGERAAYYAQQNLIAFQKLWNRFNPNRTIAEDGIFGDDTANAFENSPCNGWTSEEIM